MTKPNLLFVEDNLYFRKSTLALLQNYSFFNKIWEADSARKAIDCLKVKVVQLVFLDARLSDGDGLDVMDYIKKEKLNIPVIAITSYADAANVLHLARAGVKSILTKSTLDPTEFKLAIETVVAGGNYFTPGVQSILSYSPPETDVPSIRFTESEKSLLRYISKGLTSKEIAVRLHITPVSVDTYRKRLIEKTKSTNAQDLIGFAFRNGFLD